MRHYHRKGDIVLDNKRSLLGEIWRQITVALWSLGTTP